MRRALAGLTLIAAFVVAPAANAVVPAITTVQSSGSSVFGEAVTFTSTTLAGGVPVVPGPVSTVDFLNGSTPIPGCTGVPTEPLGKAVCVTDDLPVSPPLGHTISATYNAPVTVPGSLLQIVTQAPITVTAAPRSITYGDALPTDLTATVSGTAAGLVTGAPACAIGGAPRNAGTYDDAITCTAGTLDTASFLFTFEPADLTIAKAPLTLTANPATMTAGEALGGLGATLSGFVGGETLATSGVSGAAECAGPSPLPADAGVYAGAITCLAGAFSSVNYFVKDLVPGALTVLAPITGGGDTGGGGGGGTTNNTTNTTNVTNVGIVGGGGAQPPAATKAPTLSLLTRKLKRSTRAKLKLRSSGAMSGLKLVLKRNGKTVGKGALATLNGNGSVTLKASKKLKKGLYTLQATWAGGGKKRFSLRAR